MSESFLPPVLVELGGTADALLKTLTKAISGLERFAEAARTAGTTAEGAFAAIEAASAPMAAMAESVAAAKTEMQGLSRASNAVAKSTDKAAVSTEAGMNAIAASAERMATAVSAATASAETGIAGLGVESKAVATGLKATAAESVVAGSAMRKAGGEAEVMGAKFMGLGPVFGKVKKWGALGLAGIGIASVVLASHFETQMTRLSTAAGAPIKQVEAMKGAVLNTANAVNMSGTQMAEALYHPVSAGLDLKASLEAVKYAAEEAQISGANLDDTTYSLSSVMKAFNMSAADAGPTMADLNAIVGQGDMRFQDFNASIKNWAPTAAQMGISVNSMGSGLAYLTDRGNSAEVAATRMTMGISMMTTPSAKATKMLTALGVASTDVHASSAAMQKAMEASGITQNRLAEDLKKPDGLYVALNDLKTSLTNAGVSGTEADSVLSKIFGGGRSDKAIMSLMQNLGGLKTKFEDIEKASNMKTFDAAWERTQATFSQQMKKIKTSAENLGISLGEALLPTATAIAKTFAGAVGAIGPFVEQHKKLLGFVLAVAGGMLIAAGAIKMVALATRLWAAAQLYINTLMAIFDAEEALTGIPELIILIAALVAGIIYAWNNFDTFRDVLIDVFHAVVEAGVATWHGLEAAWRGIVAGAMWVWHGLQAAWNGVIAGVMWVWRGIVAAWHGIEAAWRAVASVTTSIWNGISGFFRKWWPLLLVLFALPIAVLLSIWNHFHTQITDTIHAAWNAIATFMKVNWAIIVALAKASWGAIQTAIIHPIQQAWGWLAGIWKMISGWLGRQWNGIKAMAAGIWGSIRDSMTGPISSAWHTITGTIGDIKKSISKGLDDAWGAVKGIGSNFKIIGSAIVNGIISGIASSAGDLFSSLKGLADDALSAAKNFIESKSPSRRFAREVGQWIPHGIAAGVNEHAHVAAKAVTNMTGKLSANRLAFGGVSGIPSGAIASARGGGTIVHNHLTIHVEGSVLAEKKLVDKVQEGFLRLAMRNPQTYQPYSR